MISPILGLLLHAAAPELDCEPTDLDCTARDSAREAREATDPRERAVANVTAARANLGLYRDSGDLARLCKARWHLGQVPRRLMSELGKLPRETREEIAGELRQRDHDCQARPRRPQRVVHVAPLAAPEPQPAAPKPQPAAPELQPAPSPEASGLLGVPVAATEPITSADPLLPAVPSSGTAPKPASSTAGRSATPARPILSKPALSPALPRTRRPGLGLMISGGVALAAGAVTGGLVAGAVLHRDESLQRHAELAAKANLQGFTDPDTGAELRELEEDARRSRNVVLGTSIATGALAATTVVLFTAGAVKSRRTSSRLAVRPLLPGLLLTARF